VPDAESSSDALLRLINGRERVPRGLRRRRLGVPGAAARGSGGLRRRDDRVHAPRQRRGGRGARLRPLRR